MKKTIAVCATTCILALGARAVPLITDDGSNWAAQDVVGGAPHTANIAQSGDVGPGAGPGITFDGAETAGVPYEDNIYTTTGVADYYAGNYAGLVDYVTFTFYDGGAYQPDELSLYFQANGNTWYYDLSTPTAGGTTPYTVFTTSGAGWYSTDGGTDFMADIATVSQVGIRIVYDTTLGMGQQDYGIGGYTLNGTPPPVPEPETVWLMMAVALSMAFTFRSRMGEVMKKLKAAVVRA